MSHSLNLLSDNCKEETRPETSHTIVWPLCWMRLYKCFKYIVHWILLKVFYLPCWKSNILGFLASTLSSPVLHSYEAAQRTNGSVTHSDSRWPYLSHWKILSPRFSVSGWSLKGCLVSGRLTQMSHTPESHALNYNGESVKELSFQLVLQQLGSFEFETTWKDPW